MQWEGTPLSGTTVDLNSNCAQVLAGSNEMYQRHFNATLNFAAIYRFGGMSAVLRWELIDDNPRTRQIKGDASWPLYQRHDNGSLWRYVGPGIKLKLISDHAGATLIAAESGGALYYTDRFGSISQYTSNGATDSTQTLSGTLAPTLSLIAKAEYLC